MIPSDYKTEILIGASEYQPPNNKVTASSGSSGSGYVIPRSSVRNAFELYTPPEERGRFDIAVEPVRLEEETFSDVLRSSVGQAIGQGGDLCSTNEDCQSCFQNDCYWHPDENVPHARCLSFCFYRGIHCYGKFTAKVHECPSESKLFGDDLPGSSSEAADEIAQRLAEVGQPSVVLDTILATESPTPVGISSTFIVEDAGSVGDGLGVAEKEESVEAELQETDKQEQTKPDDTITPTEQLQQEVDDSSSSARQRENENLIQLGQLEMSADPNDLEGNTEAQQAEDAGDSEGSADSVDSEETEEKDISVDKIAPLGQMRGTEETETIVIEEFGTNQDEETAPVASEQANEQNEQNEKVVKEPPLAPIEVILTASGNTKGEEEQQLGQKAVGTEDFKKLVEEYYDELYSSYDDDTSGDAGDNEPASSQVLPPLLPPASLLPGQKYVSCVVVIFVSDPLINALIYQLNVCFGINPLHMIMPQNGF